MRKLYITSPISIAGCLITHGFAQGFRKLGFYVVEKDVREVTVEDINEFKPDYILGYDYGYLVNEELAAGLLNQNYKFIHYFADEPQSKFAYTKRPELYELLKNTESYIFNWDSEFLNDFEGSWYLPLAADPGLYKTNFKGYEYGISFVGRPLTEKRQNIIAQIIKNFGYISLFCYKDHFDRSVEEFKEKKLLNDEEIERYKASYKGFVKTEKELARIYNSSKININVTEQGINNINYRVFEVLASSGFLITDNMKDLYLLFDAGRELEIYKNNDELIDKINFYLQNLNIAQAIARKGRKNVVNNHTFKIRAEKMLKIIENNSGEI